LTTSIYSPAKLFFPINTRFTVLLIDDDEDDRFLFSEILKEIYPGANCQLATTGTDAILALKNSFLPAPHIIFLDLNMPKMNGKQALIEIKKVPSMANVPVIIYSTSRLIKDTEELLALGAYYFLSKPIRAIDLRRALQKTIEDIFIRKTETAA
jgi:CheY-like chemotaxis protein